MTLKEIAQEVGVSISTVSRVINNTSSKAASPEVKERIWEVVRRTGYVPNSRKLKISNSGRQYPNLIPTPCSVFLPELPTLPMIPFFHPLPEAWKLKPTNTIIL